MTVHDDSGLSKVSRLGDGLCRYDAGNDRVRAIAAEVVSSTAELTSHLRRCSDAAQTTGATRCLFKAVVEPDVDIDGCAEESGLLVEARVPLGPPPSAAFVYFARNAPGRRSGASSLAAQLQLAMDIDRLPSLRPGPWREHLEQLVLEELSAPLTQRDIDAIGRIHGQALPTNQYRLADHLETLSQAPTARLFGLRDRADGVLLAFCATEEMTCERSAGPTVKLWEIHSLIKRQGDASHGLAVPLVLLVCARAASGAVDLLLGEARAAAIAVNRVMSNCGFRYAGLLHKHVSAYGAERDIAEDGDRAHANHCVWFSNRATLAAIATESAAMLAKHR